MGVVDGADGVPDRLRPVPCRTAPGRAVRANIGAAARRRPLRPLGYGLRATGQRTLDSRAGASKQA